MAPFLFYRTPEYKIEPIKHWRDSQRWMSH